MPSEPEPEFDAVAAAAELDDFLKTEGATGATGAGGGGSDEYAASLETDIEELTALLAKKDAELARANARADQAHAEIEAAGKRVARASEQELERRTRKILESFLPVIDDLDRAIAAAKQHAESTDVVEGLELVKRSMLAKLAQFGVTHVPARGEKFDPQRHDAVALVPVSDAAQDGIVIDVMREGYAIGEHTLRAASVAVGKHGG